MRQSWCWQVMPCLEKSLVQAASVIVLGCQLALLLLLLRVEALRCWVAEVAQLALHHAALPILLHHQRQQ